jgi:protein-S-isoprenylcysteine O-methyltransferase Ste14
VANFAAFGLYVPSLLVFSGSAAGSAALLLASSGALVGVAGAALVVRSRAALGPAWSFVPKADQSTGLVTTGPYRLVLAGMIPTFAWRAHSRRFWRYEACARWLSGWSVLKRTR